MAPIPGAGADIVEEGMTMAEIRKAYKVPAENLMLVRLKGHPETAGLIVGTEGENLLTFWGGGDLSNTVVEAPWALEYFVDGTWHAGRDACT